ncbi:coagulation factor XIII B chain-like [Dendropsophus ebraccatus]|uniref:coagulation factor XIII B chain-like n=1 Tax=Dendropsophus ebraccatus TaxID=150705 RepID=UPI0038321D57
MVSLQLVLLLSSAIIIISATHDSKTGTCKAPLLENGRHVPNKLLFEVGEWLQYHCDEGCMTAQRNIVENVRCLSTGWSTVPQCSDISCTFQPKTASDKLQMVYSDGPVAKFSCSDGFTLNGSDITQCYYYGWDPPLPTCQASGKRTKCPPPPQPKNIQEMKVKSDYFSGDKEVIKCKPGFQLYGAQTITCKNGQWTSPPQCVRFHECADPPSILFGALDPASIQPKYHSGSIVRYRCKTGFTITEPQEVICINGNWSLPPDCIHVADGCVLSEEEMLRNGITVENAPLKITEGKSVEFHCIGDLVPSQSLTVTCKDGKILYPQCIIPDFDSCRLSVDKIAENNLILKSTSISKVYRDGESILTRCKVGYYRASAAFKVECVNGRMIYPKCTQEKPCRINQEKLDENFLELHPDQEDKVFYENKEVIHFICKAGYTTKQDKSGLCIKEDILYPFCYKI